MSGIKVHPLPEDDRLEDRFTWGDIVLFIRPVPPMPRRRQPAIRQGTVGIVRYPHRIGCDDKVYDSLTGFIVVYSVYRRTAKKQEVFSSFIPDWPGLGYPMVKIGELDIENHEAMYGTSYVHPFFRDLENRRHLIRHFIRQVEPKRKKNRKRLFTCTLPSVREKCLGKVIRKSMEMQIIHQQFMEHFGASTPEGFTVPDGDYLVYVYDEGLQVRVTNNRMRLTLENFDKENAIVIDAIGAQKAKLKVISGGQTGVDRAASRAAKKVGLNVGGFMTEGYHAEDGDHPEYGEIYNMVELPSTDYVVRTRANVEFAELTVIIGTDLNSRGTRAAQRAANDFGKKTLCIDIRPGSYCDLADPIKRQRTLQNLLRHLAGVSIVNIAGNRNPALEEPVEAFLSEVFTALISAPKEEAILQA